MYKVFSTKLERVIFQTETWWELINYIQNSMDNIAHNNNDMYAYDYCYYNNEYHEKEYYHRDLIVYEDDAIVNLSEIEYALKTFDESLLDTTHYRYYRYSPRIFRFRYDPVPFTRKYRHHRNYRNIKLNKNYVLGVMSYMNDSRIREQYNRMNNGCDYYDGYESHKYQRSWKEHRKFQYKV